MTAASVTCRVDFASPWIHAVLYSCVVINTDDRKDDNENDDPSIHKPIVIYHLLYAKSELHLQASPMVTSRRHRVSRLVTAHDVCCKPSFFSSYLRIAATVLGTIGCLINILPFKTPHRPCLIDYVSFTIIHFAYEPSWMCAARP